MAIDDLPPFRALLMFEVVGRCLSMKRASEELAVSPGAVSQQIKILEDALGFQLIYRNATGAKTSPPCSSPCLWVSSRRFATHKLDLLGASRLEFELIICEKAAI